MIRRLDGQLVHRGLDEVVVSCGGVGYGVAVPAATKLPGVGERVALWTYLRVREDALDLFGFASREELALFESMLKVKRFPAKAALAVLSQLGVDGFRSAVAAGDVAALTNVPGIGRKSAQQLLLELRGQIDLSPPDEAAAAGKKELGDAELALVELGFLEREARERVERARRENSKVTDPAELVRLALAVKGRKG